MSGKSISTSAKVIQVAVGVLTRGAGSHREVFVTRRGLHQHQGGLLEFPGGKCEPGESVAIAMARELGEELGIVFGEQTTLRPLIEIPWIYGLADSAKKVHLNVYQVQHWLGEPCGLESDEASWRAVASLEPEQFPAANRGIILALQAAEFIQITPEYTAHRSIDGGEESQTVLAVGSGLTGVTSVSSILSGWVRSRQAPLIIGRLSILLRAKQLSAADYAHEATMLQARVASAVVSAQGNAVRMGVYLDHGEGGGLSLDDLPQWLRTASDAPEPEKTVSPGSAFVHLTATQCQYWSETLGTGAERELFYERANEAATSGGHRPLRHALDLPAFCLLSASVHNREALWQAISLGVDQVFISPVAQTQSHPDDRPLGWHGFAELCRECPVPAYGLGGLTDQDFDAVIHQGGQGVAAIRGFGFPGL